MRQGDGWVFVGTRGRCSSGVREALAQRGLRTLSDIYSPLADTFGSGGARAPCDFAIVDEAQDLSVAELRFFAAPDGNQPNALFLAGDLGQRIERADEGLLRKRSACSCGASGSCPAA